jgi:hypothetical protein
MQLLFLSASLLRMCSVPETQILTTPLSDGRITRSAARLTSRSRRRRYPRRMAASSEIEGKELDGFPLFPRNLEQTIGQSSLHVNSSCSPVSSSRTAAYKRVHRWVFTPTRPSFLTNEPAESKHPSLRIAYFSPVSRHDVLREADELQAVCTNVRVFFSGRPFFRIQKQISDFPGALLGIFSSGMI